MSAAAVSVDDNGLPLPGAGGRGNSLGLGLVQRMMASIGGSFIPPPAGSKSFELRLLVSLRLTPRRRRELIGGRWGGMSVMTAYLFKSWNCRGPAKYENMLPDIGMKEIGHVEMLATMVARSLCRT